MILAHIFRLPVAGNVAAAFTRRCGSISNGWAWGCLVLFAVTSCSRPLDENTPVHVCRASEDVDRKLGVAPVIKMAGDAPLWDNAVANDIASLASCALDFRGSTQHRQTALELVIDDLGIRKVLSYEESMERLRACQKVRGILKPPAETIDGDLRLLLHEIWGAYAGIEEASQLWSDATRSSDSRIRLSALEQLSQIGSLPVGEHFVALLQSDQEEMRDFGVSGINRMFPSPITVDKLINIYKEDSRPSVKLAALRAMERFGYVHVGKFLENVVDRAGGQTIEGATASLERWRVRHTSVDSEFDLGGLLVESRLSNHDPTRDVLLRDLFLGIYGLHMPLDPSLAVEWWKQVEPRASRRDFLLRVIHLATYEPRFLSIGELYSVVAFCPFPDDMSFRQSYTEMLANCEHAFGRVCAARALATMGDFHGIPALIAVLTPEHSGVTHHVMSDEASSHAMQTLRGVSGECLFDDQASWVKWWRENAQAVWVKYGTSLSRAEEYRGRP